MDPGRAVAPHHLRYALTLFVTGATRQSLAAIANARAFCERELPPDYELEIVDLYAAPERAKEFDIIASPTLVRHHPLPARRAVGDLSDRERLASILKVA
jgi:circadian clock protein KaiB